MGKAHTSQSHGGNFQIFSQNAGVHLLYLPAHFVCLIISGRPFDFTLFIYACAVDNALLFSSRYAVGIASETVERGERCASFRIGAGRYVIKFFVFYFQPTGNCPVDDGFELRVDRIKIDGTRQYDDIGIDHLL